MPKPLKSKKKTDAKKSFSKSIIPHEEALKELAKDKAPRIDTVLENVIQNPPETMILRQSVAPVPGNSSFDDIVKVLTRNGIMMKESIVYPNGVIKISYI